jgi:hypothetical protein
MRLNVCLRLAPLALLAGTLAACIQPYAVNSTSERSLAAGDDHVELAMPVHDAAHVIIDKLGARGFAVVDAQPSPRGYYLKFMGNRDFSGTQTIGSVFYAWLDGDGDTTHVRLIGKPTIDHVESCPSLDQVTTCKELKMWSPFAINGWEEAQVVHGVFSELRLDGSDVSNATADARPPSELGHLTLHGCGRP